MSMPVVSFFFPVYVYELLKQLLGNFEKNLIRWKCDHSRTHNDSDLLVATGHDRLQKSLSERNNPSNPQNNTARDREL